MAKKHTPIGAAALKNKMKEVTSFKKGFEVLADPCIITDADAHILYANPAVEKHTGFSTKEMLGKNPADLWGGNMPQDFYEAMWQKIKTEKRPFVGNVMNKRKDGTAYWQELRITPVLDAERNVRFFIGIEPNITNRTKHEQLQNQFLSLIGHQVKEPATAIRWILELLLEKKDIPKKERETMSELYLQSRKLLTLIEDVLTLSRLETINKDETKECNLVDMIQTIVNTKQKTHPHAVITVKKQAMPFTVPIQKALGEQLLQNIITNAVDYADPAAPNVDIELKREDNTYLFSCKDNGIGIPKAEQGKIFTRFFRASNAVAQKPSGTGLGLFIAKTIADQLHWDISFESVEGQGTTFFVRIPIPQES